MKKLFKLLVVSLVAFALVACGGGGTEGETPAGEGKTYNVGVAIYKFDDFMTLYQEEIKTAFKAAGEKDGNTYNVDIVDAKGDQAGQVEQIKNFITQDMDLIVANLVDPTGADVVIADAKAADIPVVLINREPSVEVMSVWPGKTTYVGVDATQSGIYQGEIIAELESKGDVNGDGTVNYITLKGDAGNVDAEQRTEYSIKTLEKSITTKNIHGTEFQGNWDTELGEKHTSDALTKYGKDLEVVFANNDGMAIGAVQAIEKAGNRTIGEDIFVVGVDAIADAKELLKEGKLTGTVLNDHFNQAQTVVEVAIKALNGEELSAYYWHDYVKVTKVEDAELKRAEYRKETVEEVTVRYAEREKAE